MSFNREIRSLVGITKHTSGAKEVKKSTKPERRTRHHTENKLHMRRSKAIETSGKQNINVS